MFCSTLSTPIGLVIIKATADALSFIGFDLNDVEENPSELTEYVKQQLLEYFKGERTAFDFPLEQPGTVFQKTVWNELVKIEAGKPLSYAALSRKMDAPLAIRAIAAANGKNKLLIAIPCHRVIGSKGDLAGYAGEFWRKRWLLEHEARIMNTGQATLLF